MSFSSGTSPFQEQTLRTLCHNLEQLMNQKHAIHRADRSFELSASIESKSIVVKTLLFNQDHSYYYPVEASLSKTAMQGRVDRIATFLFDYLDSYFSEYFAEEENVFVPLDWTKYEHEGETLRVRGQVLNKKLEDEADAWLSGERGHSSTQPDRVH